MACLITTDTVKIMMDRDAAKSVPQGGSALQNPDLSRAALSAMLRRGGKPSSGGARQKAVFWASFLSYYAASCANGNG